MSLSIFHHSRGIWLIHLPVSQLIRLRGSFLFKIRSRPSRISPILLRSSNKFSQLGFQ